MANTKAIVMRGPFSDDDIKEIIATVQRIDDRQPDKTFETYFIAADENTVQMQMDELMNLIPSQEGRQKSPIGQYTIDSLRRLERIVTAARLYCQQPSEHHFANLRKATTHERR